MQIELSKIHPASEPIRKSWDEDKLNELAQSIKEQGLIVPIKVRPHPELEKWICSKHGYWTLATESDFDSQELGDCLFCGELQDKFWGEHEYAWFEYDEGEIEPAFPFEVVYGHRRLEALRRNGATAIECFVEGMDDTNALIQALIENVQREDMAAIDKARAIRVLQETTGWSLREIERRGIMPTPTSSRLLIYLSEYELGAVSDLSRAGQADNYEGVQKATYIRQVFQEAGMSEEVQLRRAVADKSAIENLNRDQTRRLAEAVTLAPSEQAKKMLLEHEYSPAIHDPEHIKARAAIHGAHDPLYQNNSGKSEQKTWNSTPEVKMIIDGVIEAAKSWTMLISEIRKMVQVGKLAPEGRQFTASKLRSLAQTLTSFADELEQEKEREHA